MKLSFFDLEDEQRDVFLSIADRLINVSMKSNVKVGGVDKFTVLCSPAGTGKTFLAHRLINFLTQAGISSSVVAFTGRAAGQLKRGGIQARTIHSLLYMPVLDENGDLKRFDRKHSSDLKAEAGDVIVVDEGSMVNLKLHKELDSIGVPMIILGDSDQLDPVDDTDVMFNPMTTLPEHGVAEFKLTKSRRFDEKSGIGFICGKLREANSIPRVKKDQLSIIRKAAINKLDFHKENQFDVIICGINRTRKSMNNLVRNARGFDDDLPTVGETIMCLRNSVISTVSINNGELFTVSGVVTGKEVSTFLLQSIDEPDKRISVKVHNETWQTEQPVKSTQDGLQVFTFGYAMTAYKVQGSSVPKVLYIDEDVSYFTDQRKFRYTSCSRAMEHLTIAI